METNNQQQEQKQQEQKETNRSKRNILYGVCGAILIAVIGAVIYIQSGETAKGFSGVGEITDTMNVNIDTTMISFDISISTAKSSPVYAQSPISSIADFQTAVNDFESEAKKRNDKYVTIPSIAVLFSKNSTHFVDDGISILNEFVKVYRKTNMQAIVLIEGYTCDLGDEAYNLSLSQTRAATVKDILVKAGIPDEKIEMRWYGESRFSEFEYPEKSYYRRAVISIK